MTRSTRTIAEFVTEGMLCGLVYDWRDHTFWSEVMHEDLCADTYASVYNGAAYATAADYKDRMLIVHAGALGAVDAQAEIRRRLSHAGHKKALAKSLYREIRTTKASAQPD